MRWVVHLFLATATCAAGAEESCSSEAASTNADALLQRADITMVSEEMLQREARRQELLAEGFVERCLMTISVLHMEGLGTADALALARSLPPDFNGRIGDDVDLSSDSGLQALYQGMVSPVHDMLCHIRQDQGDCEYEYNELFQLGLKFFYEAGSSLVQRLAGKHTAKKKVAISSEQGAVDPTLLQLWEDHLLSSMMFLVKQGEDQDSMKQIASDAMEALQGMDDESLLRYFDYTMPEIAMAAFDSDLHTVCLPTTESCSEALKNFVILLLGSTSGDVSASLLKAGVGPAVVILMKALGIPEHPEESLAERAAATKAYLTHRRLSSA